MAHGSKRGPRKWALFLILTFYTNAVKINVKRRGTFVQNVL